MPTVIRRYVALELRRLREEKADSTRPMEDRIGGRYRDDSPDIDEYRSVAVRLLELTLPEKRSVTPIKKVRRELRA